jgi:hypothetical protein
MGYLPRRASTAGVIHPDLIVAVSGARIGYLLPIRGPGGSLSLRRGESPWLSGTVGGDDPDVEDSLRPVGIVRVITASVALEGDFAVGGG